MEEEDLKPVKKCVCADVSFETLRAAGVQTVLEARQRFGVCSQCMLCAPYIRRMIQTGETEFEVF